MTDRRLAIIIPQRPGDEHVTNTLASLEWSVFTDFYIKIQPDQWGNANAARNAGFAAAPKTELVLFSDCDIDWDPDGIGAMVSALDAHPEAAYAFGSYEMGRRLYCTTPFSDRELRKRNLASTMSVIRTDAFPGFDPTIERLQDWDLWLTMLAEGNRGVHCGHQIFTTPYRNGITFNGPVTYEQAYRKLRQKHNLWKHNL
jgi:hypothetical protein